jgi:hypothetical protein
MKARTYSLGKKAITRSKTSAIAQCDSSSRGLGYIFDDFFLAIVANKLLKPVHQVRITADEVADFGHEYIAIDQILREEIAEL